MIGSVLFRTRGGPTHGWGNIFRLGAFAEYCRAQGARDLIFAVEGPVEVHRWLKDRGFDVLGLPEEISVEEEQRILCEKGPFSAVIMEMLDVTWERQQMLKRLADQVVVFDDLCDHAYCADLVVCGQALPSFANRCLSDDQTHFLVGPDYFLCRPEFLPFRQRTRRHQGTARSVLVTLGGGRYDVGFLKAAMAIRECTHDLDATFILGYANHGRLAQRIQALVPRATVLAGVSDMESRLWDADLAIVSAGYSKLEAAMTGTPAAMISVQWHQIPLAQEFSRLSGTEDLGYMSYVAPGAITDWLVRHTSAAARQVSADSARVAVDGRGFERVYGAILEQQAQRRRRCTRASA